jgi:hypothetical protein
MSNKNKIILIIAGVLFIFTAITYLAKGFCEPAKNTQLTSFVQSNVPKPDSQTIDELRGLWLLFFKNFCIAASNQSY